MLRRTIAILACAILTFECRKAEPLEMLPPALASGTAPLASGSALTKLPFLLILHGFGGSGEQIERDLRIATLAREKHFVYAVPDGTVDAQGRHFWDAGPVCCNFGNIDVNDVERLSGVIDLAVRERGADPARVFVVGYSNGGFMAHRLACERSRQIRAIVSIAAAGPAAATLCNPGRPVAVLEIHGDHDRAVPFEGGFLFGRANLPISPAVTDGLLRWAQHNHCSGTLRPTRRLNLIEAIEGEESELSEVAGCGNSPIQLWRIAGGTHILPLGKSALDEIWSFVSQLR